MADGPVPDNVRNDLLDELVTKTLTEISKFGYDQLRFAQRALEARDGWLVVPEGWSGVRFEDLALRIQEKFGVPLPAYVAAGDRWLSADDLRALEVGAATTDKFGNLPVALPELVTAAKEFGGNHATPIQEGIAGPPLVAAGGSVIFFRITDTDPARVPASLDEVRDEVVADLDRLERYRELAAGSEDLRRQAIDEGLVAVAVERGTRVEASRVTLTDLASLLAGLQFGMAPEARSSALPGGIGVNEKASATIIDAALALPNGPLKDVPAAERTLVIPVEEKLSVLVVQITANQPMTAETFANWASMGFIQLPLRLKEATESDSLAKVFSLTELAARHRFSYANDAPLVPEREETASAG
jgi:hypothetical protein